MGEACEDCDIPEEKASASAKPKVVKFKNGGKKR
jgi:hypothetical protein